MEKNFTNILRNVKKEKLGLNIEDGKLIAEHIEKINPELIIESGRARGVSTEIFAKCFPDKKIISIDYDKNSQNSKYSEKKLQKYNNVKLVYGDSREIIEKYLTKKSHIFIDGPKGHEAILLAIQLFENKNVMSISLDDFPKSSYYHYILESIFGEMIKSENKNGRVVILDKEVSKINKVAFDAYVKWFEEIRPFYTKFTYKMKPGFHRNILNIFKKND